MSAWIFIALGIIFIIAEVLFMDFTLIFFGIGFLSVGILSFFVGLSWQIQLLSAAVLSIVLLVMLKKRIKTAFFKPKEKLEDNFLDESGVGEIKNGMVYYKSTFWKSDEIANLADGEKVRVKGVKNGQIVLEIDSKFDGSNTDGSVADKNSPATQNKGENE
ncbi:MAG: NfeD family protein [Campylobacter sp.]|nr:NfeD family protein [Campylobacter sp.]